MPKRSRENPVLRKFLSGLKFSLSAIFIIAAVGYSLILWREGWFSKIAEKAVSYSLTFTQKTNFSVKEIRVEGRRQTTEAELLAAVGAKKGMPMLSFSPQKANERIVKLPWVEKSAVARIYPGTIYVKLHEHVPIARWQNGNKIVVIDAKGKELQIANPENFSRLPLVVGSDAPEKTRFLLGKLNDFPLIKNNFMAARRVSQRRWDIFLKHHIQEKGGLLVKMPETNIESALVRLEFLIRERKILERDVIEADLRIQDRYYITPREGKKEEK